MDDKHTGPLMSDSIDAKGFTLNVYNRNQESTIQLPVETFTGKNIMKCLLRCNFVVTTLCFITYRSL